MFLRKSSPVLFSAPHQCWGSPGAVQTCRAEVVWRTRKSWKVLSGLWLSAAQRLKHPRVQFVFRDIQESCSCAVGLVSGGNGSQMCFQNAGGFPSVHRYSSTLCASCSSSEHPCKLHSVCCSLNESKCILLLGKADLSCSAVLQQGNWVCAGSQNPGPE